MYVNYALMKTGVDDHKYNIMFKRVSKKRNISVDVEIYLSMLNKRFFFKCPNIYKK